MTVKVTTDLSGRTVLVTGASSGLGERFARLAHAAGARVAAAARRTDRLAALAKELGPNLLPIAIDVADEASTIAAYDAIEAAFGPVDSVIANAGMSLEAPALEMSVEDFDAVFAVNMRGCFLTAREGARRMIRADSVAREHGRIVLVSSITAAVVSPGLVAYAASKAGVSNMGKVLAREWVRKGISVNMIAPGYIETEINADWFATEAGAKQVARFPRRRLCDIDALDATTMFLASDDARHVTGAVFTLDDGQSLG
jgi:NAD(P)-dependent dehydrogenase (short-subunit alcohol dehydrogenase family)